MPRLIAAALILALATPLATAEPPRIGQPEPRPRTPGTVRLATYNLENLFDNRNDPSLSGREEDMQSVKPDEQKKALAAAITAVDADVIALQEIESFDALVEFREKYLADLGYTHVQSIDVGAERGIEQAVLSRFPIVHAEVWPTMTLEGKQPETIDGRPNNSAGQPIISRRSPLAATIEVPASTTGAKPYRLTLVIVHHKSGRTFDFWREAESKANLGLIKQIQQRDPQANIALLGDFNATPEQTSVKMYMQSGLVDILSSHAPGDPKFITHASSREIDHILVNPAFEKEIVKESAFVLGTPQLKPEEDWRTAPKPAGYASDHLPVVVDFKPVDQ